MQKNKQIKALFFLGLFSLVMLHQIFPHLHHQHEVIKTNLAHSEDHHHHHDTPKKEDSTKKDLIDLFLGMHAHGFVADEIPVIRYSVNIQIQVEDFTICDSTSSYSIVYKNYGEVDRPVIYDPPNNYFNPYIVNLDLRGPPVLG